MILLETYYRKLLNLNNIRKALKGHYCNNLAVTVESYVNFSSGRSFSPVHDNTTGLDTFQASRTVRKNRNITLEHEGWKRHVPGFPHRIIRKNRNITLKHEGWKFLKRGSRTRCMVYHPCMCELLFVHSFLQKIQNGLFKEQHIEYFELTKCVTLVR